MEVEIAECRDPEQGSYHGAIRAGDLFRLLKLLGLFTMPLTWFPINMLKSSDCRPSESLIISTDGISRQHRSDRC